MEFKALTNSVVIISETFLVELFLIRIKTYIKREAQIAPQTSLPHVIWFAKMHEAKYANHYFSHKFPYFFKTPFQFSKLCST